MSSDATEKDIVTPPPVKFSINDLQSVNLRKAKPSKGQIKKEQTQFAPQLCETSEDYYRLVKDTYFENYYERIKDLTFATHYVELGIEDCKELMALHQKYLQDTKKVSTDNNNEEKKQTEPSSLVQTYEADLSKLKHLEESIANIMKKEQWKQAFIRMSIRSPKDAALASAKFQSILKREYLSLRKFQGKIPPEDLSIKGVSKTQTREWIWSYNQRIIACYRAQTFALACENAKEALTMLVKSPRIQGDMKSFVDGTYEQKFQLVVRQFEYFDVSFEFRTFIYKGKMTGLTQYNDLCYFGDLVKYKNEIVEKLSSFVEMSVKKLGMENMVLDVVMVDPHYNVKEEWPPLTLERLKTLEVKIIEVNPLAEFAGGGLFEWNKDKDVLLGEKPFEFRMQTSLSAYTGSDLMDEWKPFVFAENLD